jgi:23S rRNA (cytidine1920-2'-O)/16S rRNA (cytidine1409-2'-O)-methyltransferase
MILAGALRVAGHPGAKPGTTVPADVELEVDEPPRYVSRGGLKLEAALRACPVDPAGRVCLDIGASTGGFTDCLLQHGASRVYAVDAGRGQLAHRLLVDPRVISMERTNVREGLTLPEPISLVVADVSFISLRLVLPPVLPNMTADAQAIVLLKPQFEAGRGQVGKGGIVRDPTVHRSVLRAFLEWAPDAGFAVQRVLDSPVLGGDGNREFLLLLARSGPSLGPDAAETLIPVEAAR